MKLQFEEILDLLEKVTRVGRDRYTALCPAHPDHVPSLSVSRGDKAGVILLKCWSGGCSFKEIMSALEARRGR